MTLMRSTVWSLFATESSASPVNCHCTQAASALSPVICSELIDRFDGEARPRCSFPRRVPDCCTPTFITPSIDWSVEPASQYDPRLAGPGSMTFDMATRFAHFLTLIVMAQIQELGWLCCRPTSA